jgi:hypothetical protein
MNVGNFLKDFANISGPEGSNIERTLDAGGQDPDSCFGWGFSTPY